MAVFSSRLNECPFCVRVHSETTRIESRGEVDVDGNGPVRPELTAVLSLLEKVSRTPDDVSPNDIDLVRGAGVPDDAIVDALHVNMVFNTVNRLANAFDWAWDSDDHVRAGAKVTTCSATSCRASSCVELPAGTPRATPREVRRIG
jgi:hypothetical protein